MRSGTLLAVSLLALSAGSACAQAFEDIRADCRQMANIDLKLSACSRLIDRSLNLPARERAFLHNERGIALRRKGEIDRAILEYDEALRLNPQYAIAYNNRGYAFERKGQFEKALADYNLSIQLKPASGRAYANRAGIFKARKDWGSAYSDLTRALSLGHQNTTVYFERGFALLQMGRNDLAIGDFNEALRLSPENASVLLNRGVARHRLNDLAGAATDFREALRLSPGYALAQANLDAITAELQRRQATAGLKPLPRVAGGTPAIAKPIAVPEKPAPVIANDESRVALVIGNSAYSGVAPLRNPVNDATAVAAKLREVGFTKVTVVSNVSREAMIKALAAFSREAERADWAVVYYAGHGMQIGGVNWLIPTDASLKADRDVQFQAISVEQVVASVEGARRLRLVVLDACRDNPFAAQMKVAAGQTRAIGRGLARIEPSSTLVAFAAKDGQTALDGDGANSPFASALVRHLATPGLELNRLFRRVAAEVLRATNNAQEPLTYGRLPDEDLFFVKPGSKAAAAPAIPGKAS
jgi:tetratricopeptide (TPR) repeat protein